MSQPDPRPGILTASGPPGRAGSRWPGPWLRGLVDRLRGLTGPGRRSHVDAVRAGYALRRRQEATGSGSPARLAAPRGRARPPVIPPECASSSSGAEEHRKEEHHDVTERQAHGSQPVGVRSGETPGSPVARPPASGEIPASRRGAVQLASPQHQAKPAASLGIPAQAGQEGAEPAFQWRRPWTAPGSLERVPRNPPA
jgi:hypothetical protein